MKKKGPENDSWFVFPLDKLLVSCMQMFAKSDNFGFCHSYFVCCKCGPIGSTQCRCLTYCINVLSAWIYSVQFFFSQVSITLAYQRLRDSRESHSHPTDYNIKYLFNQIVIYQIYIHIRYTIRIYSSWFKLTHIIYIIHIEATRIEDTRQPELFTQNIFQVVICIKFDLTKLTVQQWTLK